jgi:carbonic anhydrase
MKNGVRKVIVALASVTALGFAGGWMETKGEPDSHRVKPADKGHAEKSEPPAHADKSHKSSDGHEDASDQDGHSSDSSKPASSAHDDAGAHAKGGASKSGSKTTGAKATAKPVVRKPLGSPSSGASADAPDKKSSQAPADAAVDADRALELLKEGNERWVGGTPQNPNSDSSRREQTADKGQKPFVTVLTCADSRIPVERVFDRGVGEVFAIRVAGNVAGASEAGTIEYGLGHLHTPLLVVMGHTKCGAVAAAASGAQVHGKVAELVGNITPAVDRAKRNNPDADSAELTAMAVKENVWQSIFDLYKSSQEIRALAKNGTVRVVGAIYDISTGKVEWLGEHPWQAEIIDAMPVAAGEEPAAGH